MKAARDRKETTMGRKLLLQLTLLAIAAVALSAALTGTARAQLQLNHPDQFYTNGETLNAWTVNQDAKLMSTFWFVKNPKNSLSYQQQIAVVYDNDPQRVYYYSLAEKKFIGRFEIETGKYSMLAPQDRRQKRKDIPDGAFPPADDPPSVGEMFPPPADGEPPSDEQMMMPPPTMQFPQFEKSEWDSFYAAPDGRRVRAKVTFDGNQGKYELKGSNFVGKLSDVEYEMQADQNRFEIRGRWKLGSASGFFKFHVPMDDLFVYSGFSARQPQADAGAIWDGVRTK
jgi:hypothetical protein